MPLSNYKLLYVDDQETGLSAVRMALEEVCKTETVHFPREKDRLEGALQKNRGDLDFDLLVLDVQMPNEKANKS